MRYIAKFTASLLNKFQDYLDADANYERFYGGNEEPPMTCDEYGEKVFKELIDAINRVPFESEAADRGTCLNEIVDCMVLGVPYTREDVAVHILTKEAGYPETCIVAQKGDYTFSFDLDYCQRTADYFRDSLCQVYVEAPIETRYGTVLLYGYPDYIRGDMVYDLKTTSRYEFGKYSKNWQRHLYPYALTESGQCRDIAAFEFTAHLMKGGTSRSPLLYGDMYPEVYPYDHGRSKSALCAICEQFYDFINSHRELIEDEKIFGGEKKANEIKKAS